MPARARNLCGMGQKVLIVPDKFKGTLTAAEAAEAMARGWRAARPDDEIECLPMSDGGDGFGEIVSLLVHGETREVETVDAAGRPIRAAWWWQAERRLAIVESAQVIGLAQLPRGQFHPFDLDTRGLGAVFRAAAEAGAAQCLVGIGGSSTNDGGFGLAHAWGWQFQRTDGSIIERWTELHELDRLVPPADAPSLGEVIVAVDVQNRLLGPEGATRVYGPQKGLRPEDFDLAERCLERLADCVRRRLGRDVAAEPGSGAAGGLGFGLCAFLGARLEPGFDLFARLAELRERVQAADVVVTGEGSIDASSLMGKGVGEVARVCQELGRPCLGLGGVVAEAARSAGPFTAVHAMAPELTTREEAQRRPALWLERLAQQVASSFQLPASS